MSLTIRTNISSLNAQRNLSATQSALDGSLARLSSGYRITKASDDAAGLGVSTKLEAQIRSYTQATRNANDGMSLIQSAEAALGEQAGILTRLRELAMQSASDGVGNVERSYVDGEAQALASELARISRVAEYNGTALLAGTSTRLDFQVGLGSTVNDVISLAVGGPPVASFAATAQGTYTSFLAANGWNDGTAVAAATTAAALVTNGAAAARAAQAAHEIFLVGWITAGGASFPSAPIPAGPQRDAAVALVTATAAGGTGGNASLASAYGAYAATLAGGGTMNAAFAAARTAAGGFTNLAVAAATAAQNVFGAAWANVSGGAPPSGATVPAAGAAFTAAAAALAAGGGSGGGGGGGITLPGVSLATKAGAQSALATIDAALDQVSAARATFGAAGNRFQSAIGTIQAFSESLSAANSRIKDVDVAEETSRLSRSQILAQAGISVLAQANQVPQLALKLLG